MDPDKALSAALIVAEGVLEGRGSEVSTEILARAIQDLDGWIVKGGFLPARWADKESV
jgi:hypothetical protein